jgi:N-hydroxyarylamine O-acetyltransferase
VREYLERIGAAELKIRADLASLRSLQRSHLMNVPFENLDLHWKRPIVLNTKEFHTKIVGERRGGFCYELNGLFNELLLDLGFRTRLISARVFNGTDHGPEFDHAAIIVTIGPDEYLADVGFGAFTAEPIKFVFDESQKDANGVFVIRKFDDEYIEAAKLASGSWRSEYIFRDITRELSEFTEMCDFHQYSPDSHFLKGRLCSIMTQTGRKTLTDRSFIVTNGQKKDETPINSERAFYETLEREFGIRPGVSLP